MKLIKLLLIPLLVLLMVGSAVASGNDANTVSLLHMNGSDESTTFTDDAVGGTHDWTANGNAQIDTAQSKFGGASGLFDGTGDVITTPNHADWHAGTGDVTVDSWVRFNSIPAGGSRFFRQYLDDDNFQYFDIYNNTLYWRYASGATVNLLVTCAWTPSTETWYHLAVVRSSSTAYIFIDGVSQELSVTTAPNGDWADIDVTLSVGANANGGTALDGWIDEFRWSKGIARWTANFTPPTAPYSEAVAAPSGQAIWW